MSLKPLKSHLTFGGLTQFWEHDSSETKTKMKFSTFLPAQPPIGCLIWLSGLTCTEENFMVKAGAQQFLTKHDLMVICPDTSPRGLNLPGEHEAYDFGSGAGFYLDATTPGYREHYRMYSYVSGELYNLIQTQFAIAPDRISISGHSMGGHGALMLGFKNPAKFRSVSAFSPIVNPCLAPWGVKAFTGYLGADREVWNSFDATELVKSGARHPQEILIDQGQQDEFLHAQLLTGHLTEACRAANQKITVNFRDGYDHSYYFVSSFISSHIAFHAQCLLAHGS